MFRRPPGALPFLLPEVPPALHETAGDLPARAPSTRAMPRCDPLRRMGGALTSLVAVAGTLLGSTLTYVFQRRTAGRAERFARDERLRQERVSTYSAFAEAVMAYRHKELTIWLQRHGELTHPLQERSEVEQGRLRSLAVRARYRVQLLADQPRLIELADRSIDAVADIHRAADATELMEYGERTEQRVEDFIRAASAEVR